MADHADRRARTPRGAPRASTGSRGGGGSARGYKPGEVYLRPGSRAARALESLVTASTEAGHALTLAEWRTAHHDRTQEWLHDLDGIAASLKRRRFVTALGERTRALRYAAVAAPQPLPPAEDPDDVIVDVVEAGCEQSAAAVPLEVIRSACAARGVSRSSDQLDDMLLALTTVSTRRTPCGMSQPPLECLTEAGQHWGRSRRFWRPAGSGYEAPTGALLTRAAGVRTATVIASAALQRPVAPLELKAWAAAHPEHPAAASMRPKAAGGRVTAAIRTLAARAQGRRGELVDCSHPLASDGGIPLRVGVDPSLMDLATARFADACARLRPHEEFGLCARIRETENSSRPGPLGRLAALRESTLVGALVAEVRTALHPAGGPGLAPVSVPWEEIARRSATASEHLRAWWRASAKARYPRAPRWVVEAERAATVAEQMAEGFGASVAETRGNVALTLAGQGGVRSLAHVEEWLREVLRPEGRDFTTMQIHLQAVRRFRNPACARGPLHDERREAFSLLDVGDVLWRLSELTSDANITVMLRSAVYLLGTAVRDPSPLLALLDALPPHDRYHRQGAVVALGALGVMVDPEVVLTDPGDRAGLDAYALAVGVLPVAPPERAAHLARVGRAIRPALEERLDELVERAAGGDMVTIAM